MKRKRRLDTKNIRDKNTQRWENYESFRLYELPSCVRHFLCCIISLTTASRKIYLGTQVYHLWDSNYESHTFQLGYTTFLSKLIPF